MEVCVCWYEDAEKFHHGTPQQGFNEFAAEMADAAESLLTLMTNPRANGLMPFLPKNNLTDELQSLLPSLKRFRLFGPSSSPANGLEADLVEGMRYQDQFKQRSPFEWIAGVYLPELFYLFVDNTKVGKKWGKGPEFLLFASCVLRELKIQSGGRAYSRESIAKAGRLDPSKANKDNHLRRKRGPSFDEGVNDPLEWYRHQCLAYACGLPVKLAIENVAYLLREEAGKVGQK
ncbi:MAG: hypothetical protein EKK36_01955 [Bradyrhizobiaceae bacterium]|nr:MAG: hypothetical protein EKK36_01955 [Bradyrhizobiaceae bacterium]